MLAFGTEQNRDDDGGSKQHAMRLLARKSLKRRTQTLAVLGALLLMLSGCGANVMVTKESALGQELIYRSVERAVSDLDVKAYGEGKIAVKLNTQSGDGSQVFAREYVVARLKEQGLHIVSDESQADLVLDMFIPVLGIDGSETLFGLPSIPVTLYGLTTPELALYKSSRNQGQAEIQVYAFDARTGDFISKSQTFSGSAYYNRHRLLLFINFTKTDLDQLR